MPRPRSQVRHGTNRGYHQHVAAGTLPCTPCLVAHSGRSRQTRQRGRCAPGTGWPLLPPALGEAARDA